MGDLKKTLRRVLVSQFGVTAVIGDDTGIFSSGLIDSLSVLEFVSVVEKEIGRQIPPESITLDNFDSVNRIVRFVERLTSARIST